MTTLDKILKSVRNQRYAQDFEQEKKIGIGGYASVYKSKNALDDQFYAVKKIKLKVKNLKKNMEEELERVLQEVKVLARVNHPNILRYFNSWLEVQCNKERKDSFELFDKKQSESSPGNFLKKDQKLSLKSSREYEELDDEFEDDNIVFSNEEETSQNNETREVGANQQSYEEDLLEFTDESPTFVFEGRPETSKANNLKKKPECGGGGVSMSIFNSMKKVQIADKFAEFASKINRDVEEPVAKTKKMNYQHYNHSFDDAKRESKSNNAENGMQLNRRHSSKNNQDTEMKGAKKLAQEQQPQSVKEAKKDMILESDQLEGIKSITLFIQTELCNSTLEDYITERNALLEKKKNELERKALEEKFLREAYRFAREIVNGLEYIHTVCNMVHRDMKPSNILLTEDNVVKIGDFGLVKKMRSLSAFSPSPLSLSPIVSGVPSPDRNSFLDQQDKIEPFSLNKSNFENNCEFELKIDDDEKLSVAEESPAKVDISFNDRLYNDGLTNSPLINLPKTEGVDSILLNSPNGMKHFTKDVGTKTFASPEQLSADSEVFDERADIWSLGIIFLLLFHPMVTSMEQTRAIHNAKKGSLPSKFEEEQPALAKLIKKMLSTDPTQRPYLKEIESELKKPNDVSNKFCGKIKIRREGSLEWKERWLRVAENTALVFKKQFDKKASIVFNLSDWQITLLNEKPSSNANLAINKESGSVINPSTIISMESQIQLGYEIVAEDTQATLHIHKQITTN